jgi:hypothetical protein
VFDCAAVSGGVSFLNDLVLQGPDMINSLLGVLLRFEVIQLHLLRTSMQCIIKCE